jgi:hypothetical protein
MMATFAELHAVLSTLNPWTLPTSPTVMERITLASSIPVLPVPWLMTLARQVGWAVILACLVMRIGLGRTTLMRKERYAAAGVLAVLCLLPGPWGLAYWLGLAFQVPSLSSIGLAVLLLNTYIDRRKRPRSGVWGTALACAAVVLGWLLLLDTLALFPGLMPGFMYPWGYSAGALALWVVLALLLMVLPGSRNAGMAALALAAVFVVTRLPSGNLWDALLDPWLWLFAHTVVVRRAWHGVHRYHGPKAASPLVR